MNFRTSLLFLKITIFLIVIASLTTTYTYYENESKKNLVHYIEEETLFHKRNIIFPLLRASDVFKVKQELFKKIHNEALEILKENPNTNLEALKKNLQNKHNLLYTEIHIFLINKSQIIYKTTFEKDLHFNLSKAANISHILKKAKQTNKIYFLERIVTDVADMKYKTYSYSKFQKDSFLELSFSDKSIKNIFADYSKEFQNEKTDIEIYNVSRIKNNFFYFPLTAQDKKVSKNNYFKSLQKFQKNAPLNDNVMKAFFSQNKHIVKEGDKYIVFTKLFNEVQNKPFLFQNVIAKIAIDISEQQQLLKSIKTIFIIALFATSLIMLLAFYVLKNKLIKPITLITDSIKKADTIPLESFQSEKNELYSIAKEYNTLYKKLKDEVKRNKDISYIDYLTNVNNRKSFDKKLIELINSQKRSSDVFSIMLFDIDDFKEVNDTYGHQKGDEVLVKVTNLTKKIIRQNDLLFRVGGEEFAVLFPQTNLENSKIIANKIRISIENNFQSLRDKSITISSGIYQAKSEDDINSIYKKVDSLLYKAKHQGKNTILY